MSQVVADDGDVHARLKESDRAAVAEDVGRHSLSTKAWHVRCRQPYVLREYVRDTVARERSTANAPEDTRRVRVPVGDGASQRVGGLGPQRTAAFLVAFAVDAHVSGSERGTLDVGQRERKRFADAGTGVVEEEEQGAVTAPRPGTRVGAREDCTDLLGLEIDDSASTRLLRADG